MAETNDASVPVANQSSTGNPFNVETSQVINQTGEAIQRQRVIVVNELSDPLDLEAVTRGEDILRVLEEMRDLLRIIADAVTT